MNAPAALEVDTAPSLPAGALERLCACLCDALQAHSVVLSDWARPEGGASSQTHLFTARVERASAAQDLRLVLRSRGEAAVSFQKRYDLARQMQCMAFVGRHPQPPVPRIVASSLDTAWPFFVMEAVDGVALDDSHRMFSKGPLAEAGTEQQRAFHDDCIRAIAALHALVPDADTRSMLEHETPGPTALAREIAWLRDTYEWGKGQWPQPVIDAAFDRLDRERPDCDEAVMLWGDPRPPNMIMKDFRVAACLDWELAGLGPGLLDLFWFTELNRLKAGRHRLPGFRSEAETLQLYRRYRPVSTQHAAYFRLVAATKMAVMTLRFMATAFERGEMANGLDLARFEQTSAMTDNPATRRLALLLADSSEALTTFPPDNQGDNHA